MAYDDYHLTTVASLKRWLSPKPSGRIVSVTVTVGGSGYTTATATIIDVSGVGAVLVPVIVDGVVVSISITAPGNGYVAPTVVITGDGAGATATLSVDDDATLEELIVGVSAAALNAANLKRLYDDGSTITEVRHGTGKDAIILANFPVVSISSLNVSGIAVPPSDGKATGFVVQGRTVYLVGRTFPPPPPYGPPGSVTVAGRFGESPTTRSQRSVLFEQVVRDQCVFEWQRRPNVHRTTIAAPQGMGVSEGINSRDWAPGVMARLQNLADVVTLP